MADTMPAHGNAFVVVPDLPRRFQTLELCCTVKGTPAEVISLVDGVVHCRAASPYSASWELHSGAHSVQVTAGPFRSPPGRHRRGWQVKRQGGGERKAA